MARNYLLVAFVVFNFIYYIFVVKNIYTYKYKIHQFARGLVILVSHFFCLKVIIKRVDVPEY